MSVYAGCVAVNSPVTDEYEFNHSWETAAKVTGSCGVPLMFA